MEKEGIKQEKGKRIDVYLSRYGKKVWIKAGAVLAFTAVLTGVLFYEDSRDALPVTEEGEAYLRRNASGEGSRKETLTVWAEDIGERTVEIEIKEKQYEPEELRERMQEEAAGLEQKILGENESLEAVTSDLQLPDHIAGTGIEVSWESGNEEVLDAAGELHPEMAGEDGALFEMTAVLTCGEETLRHTFPVFVPSAVSGGEEYVFARVSDTVEKKEEDSRKEARFVLPAQIDGTRLVWSRKKEQRWAAAAGLGVLAAGLLFAKEHEADRKKEEKRKQQMMLDYPEIVNKFTIYTGAGMTVRGAWGRIVKDYEGRQRLLGRRHAYEEMRITWHELGDGAGERECYERFGSRCRLQPYLKLGALLAQNLRKGSKGLSEILRLEAISAFEERKALARRQGEEAGTRLLLPMFLMLAVVLAVVIVPAFLSIQL